MFAPRFATNKPAVFDALERHAITALHALNEAHNVQRTDFGAAALRLGDVVQVQSIFRPHVTADVAVAEMDAGSLGLSLSIDEQLGMARVECIGKIVAVLRIE